MSSTAAAQHQSFDDGDPPLLGAVSQGAVSAAEGPPTGRPAPLLSVVIKCYNEEARIAACVESALVATRKLDAEIIVADALSTDETVEIAKRYPIRIVQMADPADRGCGATAQMGQQFARGEFLLLVDSDMEVISDFLPTALAAMAENPRLACVGGRHIELSGSLEFRERERRTRQYSQPVSATRLGGSALYRMAAVRDLGYFMNRNLYCSEELELGQRLRAHGWGLRYVPVDAVRHYGYVTHPIALLRNRWRSRYLDGYGQLLRGSWKQPHFWETARVCRLFMMVIAWWGVVAALLGAMVLGITNPIPLVAAILLPMMAIVVYKRGVTRGMYAWMVWQFYAAALLRGLFRSQQDPTEPVKSIIIA